MEPVLMDTKAIQTLGQTSWDKARTKVTAAYDVDLFVLGAGSGGVRASRIAAGYGARVAIAENRDLGGTCVNVGCVPKKLMVYGAHYASDLLDARAYGWDTVPAPLVWPRLIENKNREIARLNGIYGRLLEKAGVTIHHGTARLTSANSVVIESAQGMKEITAEKILVAVGGWPVKPAFEGNEHTITTNEVFYLDECPKKVLIVGGGYIAVEFSGIFHGYGSEVIQVVRGDSLLRGFDFETAEFLREQMQTQGIDFRFKTEVTKVTKEPDESLTAILLDGSRIEKIDQILCATGRVPLTQNLGLEAAGVELGKKGEILVDEFSRTNVENIFAVGDVTDRVNLTPVALAEGHCFADTEFGGKSRSPVYEDIPTAVFSQPSLGTCGLTEEEARAKLGDDGVVIFKTAFRPMKHTLTLREGEKTFMKLVVDRKTDVVVGCHIVEPAAGEIIQLVGVAMKAGATKADFDATVGVHPTAAEELVTMRTPST
eukprot:CAMPEP_0184678290 /NCGR_PEP_ID=MMETSP0312-20130426/1032_1 /TAXON_ID=31354 /ORGANISM="Compsopogon coeruleus, Strain SAG 36.94" /LENGTH=485 /DNA_ID=CAMNT_0027126931 /DNA_START=53 /DNA_END=1511 /DNA_ORIENTATION=-